MMGYDKMAIFLTQTHKHHGLHNFKGFTYSEPTGELWLKNKALLPASA